MTSEDLLPALTPELNVCSLKSSLEFYVGVVGFEVMFERPEEGFAAIGLNNACFMLEEISFFRVAADQEFIEKRRWNTGDLKYPFGRGINFLITVRDIEGIYSRLVKCAYPIKLPMEEKWYRVNDRFVGVRQFMVMDPDGFLLRFDMTVGSKPA